MKISSFITLLIFGMIFIKCFNIYVLSNSLCETKKLRKYFLLRQCQRSDQRIIDVDNFDSIEECENFARRLKGLAFNYSPKGKGKFNKFLSDDKNISKNGTQFLTKNYKQSLDIFNQSHDFFNCHAMECPENSNFTTIINDSRFDYYSLYTNPVPLPNASCLPQIGIFELYTESTNYSQAFNNCITKAQGALAHILSEERTNQISNFLYTKTESLKNESSNSNNPWDSQKEMHLKFAFIGLNYSSKVGKNFLTSEFESLDCFLYRAWAPGHPSFHGKLKKSSCVALTTQNSWITVSCKRKLSYICETYTSGPSSRITNMCNALNITKK